MEMTSDLYIRTFGRPSDKSMDQPTIKFRAQVIRSNDIACGYFHGGMHAQEIGAAIAMLLRIAIHALNNNKNLNNNRKVAMYKDVTYFTCPFMLYI